MGILVDSPQPLKNCPTKQVWEQRRGQTYLVFIDETFLQFFELDSRGYFCHAALGIPESEYRTVENRMKPIFERYCELLVPQKEFKHREFKRIEFHARWDLAGSLHDVLYEHGCFISAFYTPARSFLIEKVRVHLYLGGEAVAVPTDETSLRELMEGAAAEVEASWNGPGMSDVIASLLHTPVSGLLHFAEAIDLRLKLIYDPREPKEDKSVRGAIDRIADLVEKITPATEGRLIGVTMTSASDQEIGLQLADLAAGETRAFLDANRDLTEFAASPRLITPQSDEPIQAVQRRGGQLFKSGSVTIMPNALQRRFFAKDPKQRSVFSRFTDLLLSGMLTCYSTWGTPRHLIPYDRQIVDQLD